MGSMVGGGVGRGSSWMAILAISEVGVLRDDRLAISSGISMVGVGSLGTKREAQSVVRLLMECRSYPDMV
jgi:hypothetical protein